MKNKLNLIEDLILSELRVFNMMQFFRGLLLIRNQDLLSMKFIVEIEIMLDLLMLNGLRNNSKFHFPLPLKSLRN